MPSNWGCPSATIGRWRINASPAGWDLSRRPLLGARQGRRAQPHAGARANDQSAREQPGQRPQPRQAQALLPRPCHQDSSHATHFPWFWCVSPAHMLTSLFCLIDASWVACLYPFLVDSSSLSDLTGIRISISVRAFQIALFFNSSCKCVD
jgi:hypothetical protein